MPGFGHYRNSPININRWEPVFTNLFDVTIQPPSLVADKWGQLVLDSILKVGGLETEKMPGIVEQKFKGHTRRFQSSVPESTTVDITIGFAVNVDDSNSVYVYNALRAWSDLVYDPLTGAMTNKVDYSGGPMTVSLHTRVGDIFRQWKFPWIWPMAPLPPIELDYTAADPWEMEVVFAADYWEDNTL